MTMKKAVLFGIIFMIVCVALTSCSKSQDITTQENRDSESMSLPDYEMVIFDTYDDFIAHIWGDQKDKLNDKIKGVTKLELLVSELRKREKAVLPKMNGELMPLSPKFYDVEFVLFEKEAYEAPMIMYHLVYKEKTILIRMTELSVFDVDDSVSKTDIKEFSAAVDPRFPTAENFDTREELKDIYLDIRNSSVCIENQTIPCIEYIVHSGRDYVSFIYNGFCVFVDAELEHLDKEFWDGFSIG